ncbi:putative arabinosyltransferase arad1 [Quercus suber]|uniref:Arabinosyltransferase arad1 n=1 Tax=Quercus suber TaxID=58331 RepID=A0AAW0IWP6_QUESU
MEMREPNVTTHCLENQECGTSSSHVEPTNGAAPPSQPSHGAYASQHSQKIPVRKRNVTTQSQPTPQCEGVHRSQPASQVGEVRELLFQVLENEEDVTMKHEAPSQTNQRLASQGMHSSKFCLDPAGSMPVSCQLFDAVVSMCVPVIVSDRNIELPFENVMDYRKIAIFVDSTSVVKQGFLVTMLKNVTIERILEYQRELKLDYDSDEVFSIQDDRISLLLPAFYQDMIVRVYFKKPELVEAVSEAFENFQLKTNGMKAQVHSTPKSKKQRQR